MGGDDVQRRHGHRPDVLRCRRAAHPLRDAASWNGCARQPGCGADRDGHDAVPLDAAPVGDLCGGRAGHRLRRLPARPDAVDQLRLRTAAWATAPTAWAARSSTCWRSSPRSSVRRPRSGSAPCRSAAACTSSPGSARRATRCSSSSSRSSRWRSCFRPFPVWHGAFSGCRISTWCSPSRWRCSYSSSAQRFSSSTCCQRRSAATSRTWR